MVKVILALLLVVGCASAQTVGRTPAFVGASKLVVPAVSCLSTDTTNAWDDFIEGFQTPTTGYESNIWTEVGTTANVLEASDSSALTTYKPTGVCNQSLKVIVPTDGTSAFTRGNKGSSTDLDTIQTVISFNLYIETGPDTSAKSYIIFCYANSTFGPGGSWGVGLRLRNVTGQQQLIVDATAGTDAINVSVGQWYTCVFSLDTARAVGGSTFTLFSNGSQVGQDLFQRKSEDLQYLYFGAVDEMDVADQGTVWFDDITIKTN